MAYFIGLLIALVTFWWTMSGLAKPLILFLGAVSIVLTLILSMRLGVVTRESSPYLRLPAFFSYWVWLVGEIVKSNVRVIRACLSAELDINPALVKVKTTCRSDLAKTIFANSITLTPGTVTLTVEGDKLLVHALYEQDAEPASFETMDRYSAKVSDGGGE
ncbi:MAG: Na+/H+ antiporter subunit E [Pseudomonadota bacterium]